MRSVRVRRRKRRNYTRLYILLVVIVVIVAGVLAGQFLGSQDGKTQQVTEESGIETNKEYLHIMLMGVDQRSDDVGRSDTLMVLTVNKQNKKAELMSLPRDARVRIEGHEFDKINHAYAYGEQKLTQKTVEELLGVPMDYYIMIDTKAFEKVIDALDGVDIDVEKRMHYEDPWDDNGGLVIDLYPGMQHMDGSKAIKYVRFRDEEGDVGRINRQQHFMHAVMDKMLTPSVLPKLPKIIEVIYSSIKTDMPLTEMISLANLLPEIKKNGLESSMVPGDAAYIDGVSYWLPKIIELRELVVKQMGRTLDDKARTKAEYLKQRYADSLPKDIQMVDEGGNPVYTTNGNHTGKNPAKKPVKKGTMVDSPSQISVRVVNESGINGAGAKVASKLQAKGFTIHSVGTGRRVNRSQTTIVTDTANVNWFYGMTFPCIIMDGAEELEAVVYVGKDVQ